MCADAPLRRPRTWVSAPSNLALLPGSPGGQARDGMFFAAAETPAQPNPWMIIPFAALLAIIALAPLFFPDWWGKHYPKVAFGLASVVLGYYLLGLRATEHVLHTAHEYTSFIALIGSLYVVSGGIHISVRGETTPRFNTVFLFIGALLANLLGTTGASMLLIRPWLRMNKYRLTGHHVVFFILIVSNVGGCLTPIGDPPLFLGYLKGIPFWWVAEHCWPMWATGLGLLLFMFFVVDLRNYRKAPKAVRSEHAEHPDWFRFDGLGNVFFLAVILGAVLFANDPPFLREGLMLAAAVGSYYTTGKQVHDQNHFNFHPVQEVAILFVGIFATMMPALDWLAANARELGSPTPGFFYWGSGILSSVLDNAPTYLSFLSAVFGAYIDQDTVQQVQHLVQSGGADLASYVHGEHAEQIRQTFAALQKYHGDLLAAKRVGVEEIEIAFLLGNAAFNKFILAISVGAVFFGANTYIGNGPNFMVKAIADQQGAHTPSFLGYIGRFTLPFMVPMLLVIWLIFFA
jgi:Na+/H+ antiporter NhaD/arsenite permease-like protein